MKVKSLLYGASSVAVVICVTILTNVAIINNTFAENVTTEVDIASSINVTIPSNSVTLNLTPTNVASFKSSDLSVTVATNNPTGYTLTMAPSDSTSTSLTRTGGTETIPTLATLAGGYTEQTFTTNRWGYKLSSGNYLPFTTSNEINVTDGPSNSSASTVTLAAKGDTSLKSGAYSLTITFTAVANYVPPADVPSTCATPVPGNYTYLQDITSSNKASVLSSLTTGTAYYLRDSRDNEPYCIAKLADGKLWFLDNLRLDLSDSTVLAALTPSNTNTDAASLTSLRSGNRSAGSEYALSGFATWDSSSTPSIIISNSYNQAKANVVSKDTVVTSYGEGSGKVGIYYNYCAASAGSYCYNDGYGTGNASYDICPAGWRMPTGGSSGEYQKLYNKYSSATEGQDIAFRNALSTSLAGYFFNGHVVDLGSYGYFWSSTNYDGFSMYYLGVYLSSVYPQDWFSRESGLTVRCILQ